MTLKTSAISQRHTIVSSNDTRITKFKYQAGQKFVIESIDKKWGLELKKAINKHTIIVIVDGYILDINGDIAYALKIVEPYGLNWYYWILDEKTLDRNFSKIDYEDVGRFLIGE